MQLWTEFVHGGAVSPSGADGWCVPMLGLRREGSGLPQPSVWSVGPEDPIVVQFDAPAFVDTLVMNTTEGDEIVEIGESAVVPLDDVVHFAVIEFHITESAGGVHDPEGGTLGVGSCAMGATHGERPAGGTEHGVGDEGIAQHAADLGEG